MLDELSKSSLSEVSSIMDDFRRLLVENRRKNQLNSTSSSVPSSSSLSPSFRSESKEIEETCTPLEAANRKLTKISISFDSQSYNSHLAGFQGSKLDKAEFDVLLRRCLNINLRKVELDALFANMDADGSLLIDGVEFIRYFFHLGNEARWKILIDTKEIQTKRVENMKKRRVAEELRIKEWEAAQITKFKDSDYMTAMMKLKEAAFRWDPSNHIDSLFTQGFEAFLTPYQFKQQIDKSFGIKLTGAEIGSLVSEFSTREGDCCVDGYLFLKRFSSLQRVGWHEHEQQFDVFRKLKQRTLKMGQNPHILPKMLGR
eukprot:gene5372-5756_t